MIIKACLVDKQYLATLSSVFIKEYFDNPIALKSYGLILDHFREYNNIMPRSAIIADIDTDGKDDAKSFFQDVDSIDFDIAKNYDFLFNETNNYLKEKSIKSAILSSVDIINAKKDELNNIRKLVEDALCKDLKINLGLDFFGSMGDRLTRILTASTIRIPTYYPVFDEFISGGFPPFTLSMIVAKIHAGKSNTMANFSARQVLHGHNIAIASMEMSEDAFAQRFDSIFTLLDINKIYREKPTTIKLQKSLKKIKENATRGNLYIKQYPTGQASVNDFRIWLREMRMRDIKIDMFYFDYINIMRPSYKTKTDLYQDVKTITEEARALSFEFEIPVMSVSQLNREGMTLPLEQVDFNNIAESLGPGMTADLLVIYGEDQDRSVYENEMWYKIVKNRLGGRVGEMEKFYIDRRNLKMYDSSQLEEWLNDTSISGDARKMAEPTPSPVIQSRGTRTRNSTNRR